MHLNINRLNVKRNVKYTFKAIHIHLNICIFGAVQRATLRKAAGPPCQAESRSREQSTRGCARTPAGTARLHDRDFEGGGPGRGEGDPPSASSSPGAGAQPPSRSPQSRAGGAGVAPGGAGSAAAGGSAERRGGRAAEAPCCAGNAPGHAKKGYGGFISFFLLVSSRLPPPPGRSREKEAGK